MAAGHDSATLDEGPGGGISGHVMSMPFSPLIDALQFAGPWQQGAAVQLSLTHDHTDTVDYSGLLVNGEHSPPTHLITMMPATQDT